MNTGKLSKSNLHGSVSHLISLRSLTSLALSGLIAASAMTVAACGSSEANKSADPIDREAVENRPGLESTERGQFIDSAVSGLFYETETQEGFTDHNGYFNYLPNETISFSIGNIEIGSTLADRIVTPLEISQSSEGDMNNVTINVLRLLQTLDEDGDPSNGISISESAHLAATQINEEDIQLDVSTEAFEKNPALMQLIGQATNVSGLITHERAVAHFQVTQEQLNSNQ